MSAPKQSAQAYVQLADRLTKEGDIWGAIGALESAVQLLPSHPAAHYNLALACLNAGMSERASAGFRRAIALKSDFAHAHDKLGVALSQLGRDQDAMAAFRRAAMLEPDLADAHEHLARLLHAGGRRDEAARAYRLAAAAPGTTQGRLNESRGLIAEGRIPEAETCLRDALVLDPNNATLHWQLANLLDEAGRFDEARPLHRRAIELDPTMVEAYHNMFASTKATEADRPMLEQMRTLAAGPGLSSQQQIAIRFAVAKALADLGDHQGAMASYDAANQLRRRLAPFDRRQTARAFDWLIETFTPDFFARRAALGVADDRPIMILGMPRSGTTLVEQIVSSHRLVAAGGELPFWHSEAAPLATPLFVDQIAAEAGRLAAAYRAVLDRIAPSASRVTDKNPFNFLWIGLIHLIFPRARIIHCQRHPVDTCLSIYTTHFGVLVDYANDRGDLVFYYRQYERLMAHWRQVLPPGTMLELRYEDLTADPEPRTRDLVAFCGLEWDPACLRPEDNPRTVHTASVWQARQPVYRSSVARWRRYEPWLGELRELLDPADQS
jgi:tetratricopeptide (TPR) repeat protein